MTKLYSAVRLSLVVCFILTVAAITQAQATPGRLVTLH